MGVGGARRSRPLDPLIPSRGWRSVEKDLTSRPLTVTVGFVNRETGEIREQSVFMVDFPWMTERDCDTFIIERVTAVEEVSGRA